MKTILTLSCLPRPISDLAGATAHKFKQLLTQYPGSSLAVMCTALLTSLILCFTVLRYPRPSSAATTPKFRGKPSGVEMGGALRAASALSQVLLLQSELNGRLSAKRISAQDSIRIDEIIKQIKILQSNISSHEKD